MRHLPGGMPSWSLHAAPIPTAHRRPWHENKGGGVTVFRLALSSILGDLPGAWSVVLSQLKDTASGQARGQTFLSSPQASPATQHRRRVLVSKHRGISYRRASEVELYFWSRISIDEITTITKRLCHQVLVFWQIFYAPSATCVAESCLFCILGIA